MKTLPAQTLPTKQPSNPNLKPAPPSFLHHGPFSILPLHPLNIEQTLLISFWISIQTLSLCYPPLVSSPHDFKIHGVERSRSSRNRGRLLQDLASNRNLKPNLSSKPQTRWSLQFFWAWVIGRRWTSVGLSRKNCGVSSISQEGRSWPLGTFPGDVATTDDRFERQDPVAFPECVAGKVIHDLDASTEGLLEIGRRSFESWARFGSISLYRSGALRGLRVLALVDSPPRPCVGAFVARFWDPRLWFSDPLFGNPFAEFFYLLYASNLHLAWIRGTQLVYIELRKYEQHNDLPLQSERLSPVFLNTLCYDNLMIHCIYDNDPLNHDLNPLLSVDPLKFLITILCAIVLDEIALTVIAFDMNYKLYFPDSSKLETEQSDLNLLCVGAFSAKCFKDPDIDMSMVFPLCRRVSIILFSEPLIPQPDNFLFHSYDYLHPKLMAFRKFNPIANLPLVLDHLTHFPDMILPMTNDIVLSNTSTNNDSSQSLCFMETFDMTLESKMLLETTV